MDVQLDADVLAATLYQGLKDSQDLLEYLVKKFDGPLSHLVSVRRQSGLFAKSHPVEEITLRFEQQHYQLTRDRRGFLNAKVLKEVRGVVLKTTTITVEDWLTQLARELASQAQSSQAGAAALSRFILE